MVEKMSLTKALLEIKLTDKKILKSINESKFIDIYQEMQKDRGTLLGHQPVDKFKENALSKFQSINDLFDRRQKIKAALSKKNAETMIKIGKKEYSIAEAIELKKSIDIHNKFLLTMKNQYFDVQKRIEQHNNKLDGQVYEMLAKNLGKEVKPDSEDYNIISKPFLEANKLKIIDPLDIKEKFEKLESEIEEFYNNVDCALSEINSKTEIEID